MSNYIHILKQPSKLDLKGLKKRQQQQGLHGFLLMEEQTKLHCFSEVESLPRTLKYRPGELSHQLAPGLNLPVE